MQVTEADLLSFVQSCHQSYVEREIIPTEKAHSPVPKCLGGTKTVLLTSRDHAIHDVLQTECYEYGTFTGWYLSELEGTEWETRALKALKLTCSNAGTHTPMGQIAKEKQLGIHNPIYDSVQIEWKVKGGKTPASEKQKSIARQNAQKRNSQVWECSVTGAKMNAGNLTQYQRARGIDTSLRMQIS